MSEHEIIIIPDDDATASEAEEVTSKNRKLDPEFSAKVEWTDDEDDSYAVFAQRKKKKPSGRPRKSVPGPSAVGSGSGSGTKRARSSVGSNGGAKRYKGLVDVDPGMNNEDVALHIRTRRQNFEARKKTLKQGGLRLPPDYSDLYFSDDDHIEALHERPQFSETSGIKPCHPYKDIELDRSAGLIPASIAQYLRSYQVDGVKFLHTHFVYQTGALLGDDMGLGKTVQIAALLIAAFGKTGDERDCKRMRKMRRDQPGSWYPRALIICPGSLIENWRNELSRWGWWHIDIFHGSKKDDVLQAAKAGRMEIVITTYGTYKNHAMQVNSVEWDVVVADECHCLKDTRSAVTKAMNDINALCRIGLTGTAIQNRYDELWTLLNWANPGHFGTILEWNLGISIPLKVGQSHDANMAQLSFARITAQKLVQNLLPPFFLRRMKSLIAHQLPKKSDRVVFCPLTPRQKDAYENYLFSDDITVLRTAGDPCTCPRGSHGNKRGWCCYKYISTGQSWRAMVFPAMMTLQKLSNHLTLLIPSSLDPDAKQETDLRTLKAACPDTWKPLYEGRDSLLNLANPDFCGKWKVLKKLLRFWHSNGDKVLVFSHSVRMLRIFRYLFQNTSYSVSYLDGSLSFEDRQKTVDDFNTDPASFVFLISTKAGGVGLNITSANKVVIVDPHWNPAYDLQAQDRAYRIGQTRDVDVFRLVCAGTIEEIVYARQIYKQQQANIGYNASSERRYFKGVQKDKSRKGEIFGLHNLLRLGGQDEVVLRGIVNKTNIAEAKVGVRLEGIDIEKAVKEEEEEGGLGLVKREDDGGDDGGLGQLASFVVDAAGGSEDEDGEGGSQGKGKGKGKLKRKSMGGKAKPKGADAIQAILSSAGVEYTHENSEVIGSSRVEEKLSRRAVLSKEDTQLRESRALFSDEDSESGLGRRHQPDEPDSVSDGEEQWVSKKERKAEKKQYLYNPPEDVKKRQFCSMATEFGFDNATDFAFAVEGWTQEERRACLVEFYRRREVKVGAGDGEGGEGGGGDEPFVAARDIKLEDTDDTDSPDSETEDDAIMLTPRPQQVDPAPVNTSTAEGGVEVKKEEGWMSQLIPDSQDSGTDNVRPEKKEEESSIDMNKIPIFLSDDESTDEL